MSSAHLFVPARPLTRQDAKTLALAALGGALEFYDFVIFVFFAAVLQTLFFPPDMPEWLGQMQTFGIFAAGYLFRPLGGIVMAHFGDKFGRKRMFTLSVGLMAVPTLLIGLLPTYASIGYGAPLLLLLMRIFQGIAIGGEIPGAWVFVSEHVPYRRVGLACSLLETGLTAGILLGSLVATTINKGMSPEAVHDWGWRVPFLLGGAFGLVIVYLRQWLHETPVFAEIQKLKQISSLPIRDVIRDFKPDVVVSVIAAWMLTACMVVIMLMTPTLLAKLHNLPLVTALQANTAATIGLCVSVVIAGMACDRWGAAPVATITTPLLIASVYGLYLGVAHDPALLLPLYALAGFFAGVIGVVPIVMIQSFPATVRFTGLSLCYNLAYAVVGGLTPVVIPPLTQVTPLAPAHYVTLACVVGGAAIILQARRRKADLPADGVPERT